MKSKLFSKNPYLESDKFRDEVKKLFSLEEDALVRLPDIIVDIHLTNTKEEADEIFSRAAIDLGIDESKIKSNFSLVGVFVRELSPEGDGSNDSVSDVVFDLKNSEILEKNEISKAALFFESAKKVACEKYHSGEKKKEYQSSGMPTLIGITGTVNLRAVFDSSYTSDKDVASYNPECEGLIPVATLKLRLDSDSPLENVFFQMTPREIRMVKDHLDALELQMKKTIDFVKDGVI